MSQQVDGTTRKLSDSRCAEAYTNSLKCVEKNSGDKSKCKRVFDEYRRCKKEQFEADRQARITSRKGFFG